jgi:hypothetical protein
VAVDIKVFAYTVPAICIVMGALLIWANSNSDATTWGGNLILLGIGIQALYLIMRYAKNLRG